jgi:hypothetical protein
MRHDPRVAAEGEDAGKIRAWLASQVQDIVDGVAR